MSLRRLSVSNLETYPSNRAMKPSQSITIIIIEGKTEHDHHHVKQQHQRKTKRPVQPSPSVKSASTSQMRIQRHGLQQLTFCEQGQQHQHARRTRPACPGSRDYHHGHAMRLVDSVVRSSKDAELSLWSSAVEASRTRNPIL